jgi:hypothetical protein
MISQKVAMASGKGQPQGNQEKLFAMGKDPLLVGSVCIYTLFNEQ